MGHKIQLGDVSQIEDFGRITCTEQEGNCREPVMEEEWCAKVEE